MTEFKPGEIVEIEIIAHNLKNQPSIWREAEFIQYNGERAWVIVRTAAGPRKQSIAPHKVRARQAAEVGA